MKPTEIRILSSRPYDVAIAPGLLDHLGERAAPLVPGRRAALVCDSVVASLYGQRAQTALEAAGFLVCTYVFPQGEASKNGETYLKILEVLAQNQISRGDLLVALGGGVTGDLAGFAAATYLRGIPYLQVPTTLLAMVDSSVGGKTAINLPGGKNLAGAFYSPRLVLCDTGTLSTLPPAVFQAGCGEIIKYAVLTGQPLTGLVQEGISRHTPEIIARCVAAKGSLVQADEWDTGPRQLLNLGHTLGHGVEAGSGFSLAHGACVAVGLAMIARAAARFGFCSGETRDQILALLRQYRLPTETGLDPEILLRLALGDKKRRGSRLTLVVPQSMGDCILHDIPLEELPRWIAAGYPEACPWT